MSTNPFQTLGLAPEALRGRTDAQIQRIVRMLGRTIAQIEHPDVGGNERRFKIFQGALDELENPDAFAQAKERFLKPRKTEKEELERANARLVALLRHSRSQFRQYVEAIGKTAERSVLNLDGLELKVIDVVKAEQMQGMRRTLPNGETPFLKLLSTADGLVVERDGKRTPFTRTPIGCITTEETEGVTGIVRLVSRCLDPKTLPSLRIEGRRETGLKNRYNIPLKQAEPILFAFGVTAS